jgi:hypothetical protein
LLSAIELKGREVDEALARLRQLLTGHGVVSAAAAISQSL